MTTSLRRDALADMASYLSSSIAALTGKVCLEMSPGKVASFPSLSIIPGPWRFLNDQPHLFANVNPDPNVDADVVNHYGDWNAPIQFRLAANTPGERIIIGEAISALFFNSVWSTGIIERTIADHSNAKVIWELDRDQWTDSPSLAARALFEGVMTVDCTLPILSVSPAYMIDEVRLYLDDLDGNAERETYSIDENGVATPL